VDRLVLVEVERSNDEMGSDWYQWRRGDVVVVMILCLIIDYNTTAGGRCRWRHDSQTRQVWVVFEESGRLRNVKWPCFAVSAKKALS